MRRVELLCIYISCIKCTTDSVDSVYDMPEKETENLSRKPRLTKCGAEFICKIEIRNTESN